MKKKSAIVIIVVALLLIALPIILYIKDNIESKKVSRNNYVNTYKDEETLFNEQWTKYEGAQGGNNVKAVLQKLIANCNTNREVPERLVDVYCSRPTEDGNPETIYITVDNCSLNSELESSPIKKLTDLRNQIEAKHTYYVSIEYVKNNPFVNRIVIKYEMDDSGPTD